MSTNIGIEVVEAIRSAAESVVEAIDDYDHTRVADRLDICERRWQRHADSGYQRPTSGRLWKTCGSYTRTWLKLAADSESRLEISCVIGRPGWGTVEPGGAAIIDRVIWENWDEEEVF